jgi:DNA-binding helix-hairpin-helix protein with protein kinase domain
MNEVYDETGSAVLLGNQFASGGQGEIYRLKGTDTLCAKVYHEKPDALQTQKLKLLRSRAAALSKVAAVPKSLAFADARLTTVIGIIIPFVRGHEVHELYGTRARLHNFPKANFKFLVHAAYNLALVFDDLHRSGIVVADISEQNIKVLPDATVRLIDCDSFQVSDGDSVFTSDMGTPLWIPPELQGKNLTGLHRTPNHDLFGLAQLIFLLCFAGRHPFAGVPRGSRQLSPEAAIGEHAFAFAPDHLGLPLTPPPGCPPFSALPPKIQQLFSRAFLKGSEQPDARPQACEWKDCLEEFLKELTVCAQHRAHVFWKQAPACPWCAVMRDAEVDLFPPRDELVPDAGHSVAKDDDFVMQLRNLRPHPFNVQPAPIFDDLLPEPLPSAPTGLWNSLQKTVAVASWKNTWLSGALLMNQESLVAAEVFLSSSLAAQQALVAEYNQEFSKIRTSLLPALRLLSTPAQVHGEIETALVGERRKFELQEFLEHLSLREAALPGVGLGDKTILLSYGIETAADVTEAAIGKIPGFSGVQSSRLLAWRKTCETSFLYDPSKPLSGLFRQEIERRVHERLKLLKEEATGCETKFNELQRLFNARLRLAQVQTEKAARQRDQARVNLAFIEEQLRED